MENEKLLERVGRAMKIYRGLDRHCRCGCGGKYARVGEPAFKRYQALIRRGLASGEIAAEAASASSDGRCEWVNIPVGDSSRNKCFTLYFDPRDKANAS